MKGFGDLPEPFGDPARARVAIVPVPYDGTSTWLKGADRGPEAIIEASAHLELYDIETGTEPYRRGILTDEPVTGGRLTRKPWSGPWRQRVAGHCRAGRFPVVLGGEHSVEHRGHARRRRATTGRSASCSWTPTPTCARSTRAAGTTTPA